MLILQATGQLSPAPVDQGPLVESFGAGFVGLADASAFIHALVASFSVILVSELGDKTFIITAIMAMKNSRLLVFIASALALLAMTIMSVGMGLAVTVIPPVYTHYLSVVLFICFGLKMFKEAYDMPASDPEGESEFDEVKRSLEQPLDADSSLEKKPPAASTTESEQPVSNPAQTIQPESSSIWSCFSKFWKSLMVAPLLVEVFTMIFVAEWGDRSQISTIILAAREDVIGVFIGSFAGHVLCTGLAVIGGRFVADMISVRTMTFIGGLTFLFFAASEIIAGP